MAEIRCCEWAETRGGLIGERKIDLVKTRLGSIRAHVRVAQVRASDDRSAIEQPPALCASLAAGPGNLSRNEFAAGRQHATMRSQSSRLGGIRVVIEDQLQF